MERILESRKAFVLERYQSEKGFNQKALERDAAALALESSGNIHSFFLALLPDGRVINPSISKAKDVKSFYSEETPQSQKEKSAGLKIREALISEEPGTIFAWISPPGGEFNYQEARLEIGKLREILGIRVLQSYGIPLKNVTPEYCEKIFLILEEFSNNESQKVNNPEDLRGKISILKPPLNLDWIDFLLTNFPELSEIFQKIKQGDVNRLKIKALKDVKDVIGKTFGDNSTSKFNLIYLGAQIEAGIEEKGWDLTSRGCGYLNTDLIKINNKNFFGMATIASYKDKYGSLEFECPHCHKTNNRELGKLLSFCQHCGKNVSCK